MQDYAIITKLIGNEFRVQDLSVGQIVHIGARYGASEDCYVCTVKDVNSPSANEYPDGEFETILCESQLKEIGFGWGTGFSGIVLEDGSWIECGVGCHCYVLDYLADAGYIDSNKIEEDTREKGPIFLSSGSSEITQYVSGYDADDFTPHQIKTVSVHIYDKMSERQKEDWLKKMHRSNIDFQLKL